MRRAALATLAACGWTLVSAPTAVAAAEPEADSAPRACAAPQAPVGAPYYAIDLVPTGRVPGTRRARGEARVAFASSPFGLAVNADGRYVVDLSVEFSGLAAHEGDYVVWVARADLSEARSAGRLEDSQTVVTRVEWNKFLVVITLEPDASQLGSVWTGPVVFRGMSRSGRMHTMAGHGPFQAEPCSKYGY